MVQAVSPTTLKSWLGDGQELALLDVREHGQYGHAHLFHAVHLPFSRLELDIARLVPRPGVRCVVYDDSGEAAGVAQRAAQRLAALGYGNVAVLEGGAPGWKAAGYGLYTGVHVPSKSFGELAERAYHTPSISADELAGMLARGERVTILDGRPQAEFRKMNIPTAICCPNGELAYRVRSLVPDDRTPIVINCAGRTRSIIGAQTLLNLGIPNPVYALENGTQGWYLSGHELEHGNSRSYAPDSGSDALLEAARRLAAEAGVPLVDAATAAAWAADARRTLYLCDVRTAEEFARGSLPGARHTPGGQLIQAFDQYIGVRGARLLLVDDDGIRARTVASWLRQMGHDASVLQDGLRSGFALRTAPVPPAPLLATVTAAAAAAQLDAGRAVVLDLRGSMDFRKAHIAGARWTIRPLLRQAAAQAAGPVILVADEPALAAWAVETEWPPERERPVLLQGGLQAWQAQGLALQASPQEPPDEDCIDFLLFAHDRHDGNKEAARRYLAWETGLIEQLDEQERSAFRLPAPHPAKAGHVG